MRSFISTFICLSFLCTGCDDGDIVVTSFNFDPDDASFDLCSIDSQTDSATIFFKESNDNEVIFFENTNVYDNRIAQNNRVISLSDGEVTYRKYNSSINASDLFCQAIAPTEFKFDTELKSDRGQAILFTNWEIDPDADDDGDGLLNRQEGIDPNIEYKTKESTDALLEEWDTDGDNIPNFRDDDDDNDNIKTIDELSYVLNDEGVSVLEKTENDEGVFEYTLTSNREANLPDHLNDDDDGDGVKTYNEVLESGSSPKSPLRNIPKGEGIENPDDLPASRLPSITKSVENDIILRQTYSVNTRTFLRMEPLGLTDGNSTTSFEVFDFGEQTERYTETIENLRRSEITTTSTP